MLVSVCASPCMMNVDPAATLQILQHLEETAGVSVPLTITMATMMLRLGNRAQYTELMERHPEVCHTSYTRFFSLSAVESDEMFLFLSCFELPKLFLFFLFLMSENVARTFSCFRLLI